MVLERARWQDGKKEEYDYQWVLWKERGRTIGIDSVPFFVFAFLPATHSLAVRSMVLDILEANRQDNEQLTISLLSSTVYYTMYIIY